MKNAIKDILRDDPLIIVDILEELGFHEIKMWSKKEIRACLPNGDNPSSVSIKLNQWLNAEIYTRSSFDDYDIRDIFTLIMFVSGKNLKEVEKYLCFKTGMTYEYKPINRNKSNILQTIRNFKIKEDTSEFSPEYLSLEEYDKYESAIVQDWLDEGINEDTQRLFEVCVNKSNGRWCFPLYDEIGLRSFKGRVSNKNWKQLGLMKYLYMPKIGRNDIMYGFHLTEEYIREKGEVILVEGEKSVMKLFSNDVKNVIAVGKKGVNPHLLPKIKELRVDVVLAFDEDVNESELKKECDKLNHITNVSYLLDSDGLLSKKDAPIDQGIEVWNHLYKERRRG